MNEIIYCSDIEQLKQELVVNGYWDERHQIFNHNNELTRIYKNDAGESVAYVMNNKLDLELFPSLESLGDYEAMEANTAAREKYMRVQDYETPKERLNDAGEIEIYYLNKSIGVFAL